MAGKFSDDYKEMVIELILEGKKSQNQIGRELGIPRSTLSGWQNIIATLRRTSRKG